MVDEFPSNKQQQGSRNEQEPKDVNRVVQTKVVRRKKSLSKRFKDAIIGGDSESTWAYVAQDVLLPAAKDMIADAVSQGVEKMVFGDTRNSRRGRSRNARGPRIDYQRVSSPRGNSRRSRSSGRSEISSRARSTHDFDEIVLQSRVEANEVVDRLFDLVSKYEQATVSDLYSLVGISSTYTDDKWGWYDLAGASVARVREGYLLDLPKPEPLD